MKRTEIIRLVFTICLIITGNILQGYTQSKMDMSNMDIVESFKAHNLPEITHHILNDNPSNGSIFYVGKTMYMLHIEVIREPYGYVDTRNIGYRDAGLIKVTVDEVIPKGNPRKGKYKTRRTYDFTIDNEGFQVYSDNIFFNMKYRSLTEKEKRTIRVDDGLVLPDKVFDLQENISDYSELKLYGFLYAYDFENDKLMKVADYIVRDADGRANSIGKHYGKNRTFTDN